jgi:hypothetical protein
MDDHLVPLAEQGLGGCPTQPVGGTCDEDACHVPPSAAITCIFQDRGPERVGCTERASQPGRICRTVSDVDETLIKIKENSLP